jgi:hypothetical protein
METQKLLKYLETVVELERNKYVQINTINSINNKIKSYENQINNNNRLMLNEYDERKRSTLTAENVKVDKSGKWLAAFGIYYCAFMGAVVFGFLARIAVKGAVIPIVAAGAVGAVAGGVIPWRKWRAVLKKRRLAEIKKFKALQIQDDVAVINRDAQTKDLQAALPKLQKSCEAMKKAYSVTDRTLNSYYNMNIIPVKYRSMLPVCMFYDYILNKRTYSLERNPVTSDIGAINMYEEEVYKKVIIGKLNEAIRQMKMIRNNQEVFYEQMIRAQNKTHQLLTGINDNITGLRKDVAEGLDAIKYQNEQILKCEKYMSYVTYQNYMS